MSWMRKIVLLMLLALFPLQSSWAVVSTSCSHEYGSASNHLGHHEHAHESLGTDEDGSSKAAKKISLDRDCVFHGDHIKPLITKGICTGSVLSMSLKPFLSASYASAEAGRPEKPNWRISTKPVGRQSNQYLTSHRTFPFLGDFGAKSSSTAGVGDIVVQPCLCEAFRVADLHTDLTCRCVKYIPR